jgi:hypothetical protein
MDNEKKAAAMMRPSYTYLSVTINVIEASM